MIALLWAYVVVVGVSVVVGAAIGIQDLLDDWNRE